MIKSICLFELYNTHEFYSAKSEEFKAYEVPMLLLKIKDAFKITSLVTGAMMCQSWIGFVRKFVKKNFFPYQARHVLTLYPSSASLFGVEYSQLHCVNYRMMKYSIVNFIATATTTIGLITDIIKYIPIEYEYSYHTSSLHLLEFNGHQPSAIKKKKIMNRQFLRNVLFRWLITQSGLWFNKKKTPPPV